MIDLGIAPWRLRSRFEGHAKNYLSDVWEPVKFNPIEDVEKVQHDQTVYLVVYWQ